MRLSLDVDRHLAAVTVQDTGIGIRPELLPRIFEPFVQADRSLDRSPGGLGLGLPLVKGLVELHGGSIRAFSDGEGRGSEFVMTLPRAPAEESSTPESGDDTGRHRVLSLRVLVADDNRDSALSWSILVEGQGHDVEVAYDGLAALKAAEAIKPQVALLDIGMPHMDGFEVARRIRATRWGRNAYLVAITGWGQARDKALAIEAGFDEHHTKPLNPDHLERLLRNASRKLGLATSGLKAVRGRAS
jgi:CheY-like chemotaxis protein